MEKRQFKPGNMLYPVPAVLVTAADREGNSNIFTVAWAGTICTNPPMLSISVRPERHSYHMIRETGEFVVNLTTESMAWATDYCGVRSGRDTDKWKDTGLTPEKANVVNVPVIKESPVNIECRVVKVEELGSHHMFIADVVAVDVDEAYMDEKDTFHLSMAKPLAYSHGRYYGMGEELGSFGYSVRKAEKKKILIGKTAGKQAGRKAPETGKKTAEKELQPRRKAGNKAGGKTPETGKKTSSERKNIGNPGRKAGSGAVNRKNDRMCDSRKDFSDEEEKYSDDRNAGIRKEHHRRAACKAPWLFLRGCGSCDPGEDRKTFEGDHRGRRR